MNTEQWKEIKQTTLKQRTVWNSSTQGTFNAGRNKAKRERRELHAKWARG